MMAMMAGCALSNREPGSGQERGGAAEALAKRTALQDDLTLQIRLQRQMGLLAKLESKGGNLPSHGTRHSV